MSRRKNSLPQNISMLSKCGKATSIKFKCFNTSVYAKDEYEDQPDEMIETDAQKQITETLCALKNKKKAYSQKPIDPSFKFRQHSRINYKTRASFFFRTTDRAKCNSNRVNTADPGKYKPNFSSVFKSVEAHSFNKSKALKKEQSRSNHATNVKFSYGSNTECIASTERSKPNAFITFKKQLSREAKTSYCTISASPDVSTCSINEKDTYLHKNIRNVQFNKQIPHKGINDRKETFLQEYNPNKEVVLSSLNRGCNRLISCSTQQNDKQKENANRES